MSNAEMKEYMDAFKAEIKAEIKTQSTITDLVVIPKIDTLIKRQEEANHKVAEHEKRITKIEWVYSKEKLKYITQVIVSGFIAALIIQYGILEFLKLVR